MNSFPKFWRVSLFKNKKLARCLCFLCCILPFLAQGKEATDDPNPSKAYEEITFDLEKGKFDKPFPFDVPFYVCGEIPKTVFKGAEIRSITFYITKERNIDFLADRRRPPQDQKWASVNTWINTGFSIDETEKQFCILFPPLPSDTEFQLAAEFVTTLTPNQKNRLTHSLDSTLQINLFEKYSLNKSKRIDEVEINEIGNNLWKEANKIAANPCYTVAQSRFECQESRMDQAAITLLVNEHANTWQDYLQLTSHYVTSYEENYLTSQRSFNQLKRAYNDCLKLLFQYSKFENLHDGPKYRTAWTNFLKPISDNQLAFISKGEINFEEYPARSSMRSFTNGQVLKEGEITRAINNLNTSEKVLNALVSMLGDQLLVDPKLRYSALYPELKNGKVIRSEFALLDCLETLPPGDSIQVEVLDQRITEVLKTFHNALKDARAELTTVKNSLYTVKFIIKEFAISRKKVVDQIINDLAISTNIRHQGTTHADFQTRGKYYITADAGFAFIPDMKGSFPYFGVNFNLNALNRERKYSLWELGSIDRTDFYYSYYEKPFWYFLRKNTSVVIGVLPFDIAQSDARVTNLWQQTGNASLQKLNLLTGMGLRLTDGVRVSGGIIWMKQANGNPLQSPRELQMYGYGALSLDLDLAKYAKGFFGYVFPGQSF